jgi:uncharacterized RDD family membrane protein YckC
MYCPQCSYNNPVGTPACKNCDRDLSSPEAQSVSSQSPQALIYAGFWLRFFAVMLDLFFLGAVFVFVLGLSVVLTAYSGRDDVWQKPQTLWLFLLLTAATTIAYYIFTETSARGATLGKRWMNLKVLDNQGKSLTLRCSTLRLFAHFFSLLPLLLGYLIQPFTQHKQALHDVLVGTVVVRSSESNRISIMATLMVLLYIFLLPAVALVTTTGMPYYRQTVLKAQLENGVQAGLTTAQAVAAYYLHNGKIPASIELVRPNINLPPHISGITINLKNGELTVTYSELSAKALGNKHLIFTPTLQDAQTISWRCHTSDIEQRLIPASCQ